MGEFCVSENGPCFPINAPTASALDTGHTAGTNPPMPANFGDPMGWPGTVKFVIANYTAPSKLLNDGYLDTNGNVIGTDWVFELHLTLLADIPSDSPATFTVSDIVVTGSDTLLLDASMQNERFVTSTPP